MRKNEKNDQTILAEVRFVDARSDLVQLMNCNVSGTNTVSTHHNPESSIQTATDLWSGMGYGERFESGEGHSVR